MLLLFDVQPLPLLSATLAGLARDRKKESAPVDLACEIESECKRACARPLTMVRVFEIQPSKFDMISKYSMCNLYLNSEYILVRERSFSHIHAHCIHQNINREKKLSLYASFWFSFARSLSMALFHCIYQSTVLLALLPFFCWLVAAAVVDVATLCHRNINNLNSTRKLIPRI